MRDRHRVIGISSSFAALDADTLAPRKVKAMAEQEWADLSGIFLRRRASDRARERAGRAAYFGDRAGLLIATANVEQLVFSREIDRRRVDRPA